MGSVNHNSDSAGRKWKHIDGLVQDCDKSIADALELPQSYAKPSSYLAIYWKCHLQSVWHFVSDFNLFLHPGSISVDRKILILSSLYCSTFVVCYFLVKQCTVWCCYNTVHLLQNLHKRHPTAGPLGRDRVCILWVQTIFCLSYCSDACHIMLY